MPNRGSKTLRRQQGDLEAFTYALRRLLSVLSHSRDDFLGGAGLWAARPGGEAEAGRLADEVNRVAGRAAVALDAVGAHVAWKPRGQPPGYSQPVNPALAWTTILSDDPMFGVDVILTVCDQAIGILDSQASEAEEHEQSFEGRVQHAAGFLDRVRPAGRSHRAGVITGVIGTIVATVIAAYIVHVVGWA